MYNLPSPCGRGCSKDRGGGGLEGFNFRWPPLPKSKGEQESTETLSFRCNCERCRFMRGRINLLPLHFVKSKRKFANFSNITKCKDKFKNGSNPVIMLCMVWYGMAGRGQFFFRNSFHVDVGNFERKKNEVRKFWVRSVRKYCRTYENF